MIGFFDRLAKTVEKLRKKSGKTDGAKKISAEKSAAGKQKKEIQQVEITISSATVFKVLFVAAVFLMATQAIVQLSGILTITGLTFILAIGLTPIVSSLEERKIPRPIAILLLYILFLGGLTILFVKVIPIIAEQLLGIAGDVRNFIISREIQIPILSEIEGLNIETTGIQNLISDNLAAISKNLQSVAGSTFSVVTEVFASLFNFIFTLVLLFFVLMEREQIGNFFLSFVARRRRDYVFKKSIRVQEKMSKWFRGQFFLMVLVGLMTYVGMKFFEFSLGMEYAATIAIVAGFMELFPYIGVTLTGLLAGLVALNQSPTTFLAVLVWLGIVQFVEGNILVPVIMEKVVGLSSVVVMIVLAAGATLGYASGGIPMGILGMIFSVPISASVAIFVEEYVLKHKDD